MTDASALGAIDEDVDFAWGPAPSLRRSLAAKQPRLVELRPLEPWPAR